MTNVSCFSGYSLVVISGVNVSLNSVGIHDYILSQDINPTPRNPTININNNMQYDIDIRLYQTHKSNEL